ncbi:TdeIII family type II restriction endonuclease [Microcoleus sp. CAWBG640]|uniref:TdeIII family type II restriction endonuclease n=1 Tax=Microcoleus sp. CAWBG640 TaxID=2841653 RepID=UPI00312B6866
MTAIGTKQREIIKGYLEGFIQGIVDEYKGRIIHKSTTGIEYLSRSSTNGELKPFQAALIPIELIRINQFERGLSTRLGNSIEECAKLIALEHHTVGLQFRDVDVLTVQDDGRKGMPDTVILDRAMDLQRVVFTQDEDFLAIANRRQQEEVNFSGVIYAHQQKVTFGDCIRDLEIVAKVSEPEDFVNRVQYLPL